FTLHQVVGLRGDQSLPGAAGRSAFYASFPSAREKANKCPLCEATNTLGPPPHSSTMSERVSQFTPIETSDCHVLSPLVRSNAYRRYFASRPWLAAKSRG